MKTKTREDRVGVARVARGVCWLGVMLAGLVMSVQAAQVPTTMDYQGQVLDEKGNPPPAGNAMLTFRIFDSEYGGNLIWGRVVSTCLNADGTFALLLGEGGSEIATSKTNDLVENLSEVFQGAPGEERWLEVQYGNYDSFDTRQKLVSWPYVYSAVSAAESTGDFDATQTVNVDGETMASTNYVVTEDATFEGLVTAGNLIVSNELYSYAHATIKGELNVAGTSSVQGSLTHEGAVNFQAPVDVSGTLTCAGPVSWFGPIVQLGKLEKGGTTSGTYTKDCDGFYIFQHHQYQVSMDKTAVKKNPRRVLITLNSVNFTYETYYRVVLADNHFGLEDVFMLPVKKDTEVAVKLENFDDDKDLTVFSTTVYFRPMYREKTQ